MEKLQYQRMCKLIKISTYTDQETDFIHFSRANNIPIYTMS